MISPLKKVRTASIIAAIFVKQFFSHLTRPSRLIPIMQYSRGIAAIVTGLMYSSRRTVYLSVLARNPLTAVGRNNSGAARRFPVLWRSSEVPSFPPVGTSIHLSIYSSGERSPILPVVSANRKDHFQRVRTSSKMVLHYPSNADMIGSANHSAMPETKSLFVSGWGNRVAARLSFFLSNFALMVAQDRTPCK